MKQFLSSVQSFVHSVTTKDRYASYRSQYASSKHTTGQMTRDQATAGLVGAADDEGFSQVGILHNNASTTSVDGLNTSSRGSVSDSSKDRPQYVPGMRSNQIGNGGIPLQEYADGLPVAPQAALSWTRIDRWLDARYPELHDQINLGVTAADLNELESDLDCTLPLDVRDSYMMHDGQERGGKPTGIVFGITLLDLESISEEWTHWKNTAIRLNNAQKRDVQQNQRENRENQRAAPSSSAASSSAPTSRGPRQPFSFLDRQESVPPGAIQRVYAHPGWIPLAKDFEGNNIAVDLAPGPRGRWGQVILFGRDFDRKYVVAPSWAAFLATLADDLEAGDHYIDEDIDNGTLMFRAPSGRLVPYFDVLRSRVDRALRNARARISSGGGPPKASSGPSSRPGTPSAPAIRKTLSARPPHTPSGTPSNGPNLISPNVSMSNLPAITPRKEQKRSVEVITPEEEVQKREVKKNEPKETKENKDKQEGEQEDKQDIKENQEVSTHPKEGLVQADAQEANAVDMLNEELADVEL